MRSCPKNKNKKKGKKEEKGGRKEGREEILAVATIQAIWNKEEIWNTSRLAACLITIKENSRAELKGYAGKRHVQSKGGAHMMNADSREESNLNDDLAFQERVMVLYVCRIFCWKWQTGKGQQVSVIFYVKSKPNPTIPMAAKPFRGSQCGDTLCFNK